MDKRDKIYDLYLSKGIITESTTREKFKAANPDIIAKLYDLGAKKGLFQTTDLETFSSAWQNVQSEPQVQTPQAEPQAEVQKPQVKKKEQGSKTLDDLQGSYGKSFSQTDVGGFKEPEPLPAVPQPNIKTTAGGLSAAPLITSTYQPTRDELSRVAKATKEMSPEILAKEKTSAVKDVIATEAELEKKRKQTAREEIGKEKYNTISSVLRHSKPAEDMSYIERKARSGMLTLGSSIYRTPEFVYDIATNGYNLLLEAQNATIGTDAAPLPTSAEILKKLEVSNAPAEIMETAAREIQKVESKYDKSIIESIKEGEYGTAVVSTAGAITESLPFTLAIMIPGLQGASIPQTIAGTTLVTGAGRKQDIKQEISGLQQELESVLADKSIPQLEKDQLANEIRQSISNLSNETLANANSIAHGLAESLEVLMGAGSFGRNIRSIAEKEGVGKAKQFAVNVFDKVIKDNPYLAPFSEGIQEGLTTYLQNVSDVTILKQDKEVTEGIADAFIVGAVMGSGFTAATEVAKYSAKRENISRMDEFLDGISSAATNGKVYENVINDIDQKVNLMQITPEQAQEQKGRIDSTIAAYNAMPTELSREQQREALPLIIEKREIEAKIEGKDPAMIVNEKARIEEINNKLQEISNKKGEQDAVQISETAEVDAREQARDSEGVGTEVSEQAEVREEEGVEGAGQEEITATEQADVSEMGITPELAAQMEAKAQEIESSAVDVESEVVELEQATATEGVAEVPELKDVESTAKALEEGGKVDELTSNSSILGMKVFDNLPSNEEHNKNVSEIYWNKNLSEQEKEKRYEDERKKLDKLNAKYISDLYHKAKADGSNPELVKAVESLLVKEQPKSEAPKPKAKSKKQPKAVSSAVDKLAAKLEAKAKKPAKEKAEPSKLTKSQFMSKAKVVIQGDMAQVKLGNEVIFQQPKNQINRLERAWKQYRQSQLTPEQIKREKNKFAENIRKKYSAVDVVTVERAILMFFAMGGKLNQEQALKLTGYKNANDLPLMVSKDGSTIHELMEQVADTLGRPLEEIEDEFNRQLDNVLQGGIGGVHSTLNDIIREERGDDRVPPSDAELIELGVDRLTAEQQGLVELGEEFLVNSLTSEEVAELDAIIAEELSEREQEIKNPFADFEDMENDIFGEAEEQTIKQDGKQETKPVREDGKIGTKTKEGSETSPTDTRKDEAKREGEQKSLADKIRNLKAGDSRAFDATIGIPVAVYNGAVELVATSVEAGIKLGNAIAKAMKYIDSKMGGKKWNKGLFAKEMNVRYSVTLPNGSRVEVERDITVETAEVINGWYQPIEQKILDAKTETKPANKWAEYLRSKEDEDLWTGVRAFLESKGTQSVTKKELQDFIKNNRVEIVEVVKGEKTKPKDYQRLDEIISTLNERGYDIEVDDYGGMDMSVKGIDDGKVYLDTGIYFYTREELIRDGYEVKDTYEEDVKLLGEAQKLSNDISYRQTKEDTLSETKFSQYQLEGEKENYKELLVTMPSKSSSLDDTSIDLYGIPFSQLKVEFPNGYESKEQRVRDVNERMMQSGEAGKQFKSSHFDEPNILVHLRMNTRTDADGNKVLFLEELQSDWGQKGKKEGFKISEAEQKARNYYPTQGVPQAPFVTSTPSWVKLGIKTAIKEAVNQGATKIAWTTGEQQADRYSLAKQVNSISVTPHENGRFVFIDMKGNYDVTLSVDKNGKILKDKNNLQGQQSFIDKSLDDVVGKDMAQKILSETKESKYEGEGLKVGGSGMKGFYDKIVPDVAKAVVKELTGQEGVVGKVKLIMYQKEFSGYNIDTNSDGTYNVGIKNEDLYGSPDNGFATIDDAKKFALKRIEEIKKENPPTTTTQQSIEITPELKASVQAGIPLFGTAKAKAELAAAKKAFDNKLKSGLQSGGLAALPEFARLVKAYAKVGILTAQDFLKRFKEDFKDTTFSDKDIVGAYKSVSANLQKEEALKQKVKDVREQKNQQIEDIKRSYMDRIKQIRANVKNAKETREELTKFISENITKDNGFTDTDIKRLNSLINKVTPKNYIAALDRASKLLDAHREKVKKQTIKDIYNDAVKNAKVTTTASGRKRSDKLTAEDQSFMKESVRLLKAIITNNTSELAKIKDSINAVKMQPILFKQSLSEPLAAEEKRLLDRLAAFELLGDIENMTLEEVQDILKDMKELFKQGRQKLIAKKAAKAQEKQIVQNKAATQIQQRAKSLYVVNEDGETVLKDPDQIIATRGAIRKALKEEGIISAIKTALDTFKFSQLRTYVRGISRSILTLETLTNALDNPARGLNFFRDYVYRPLARSHTKELLVREASQKAMDDIAKKIFGKNSDYKKVLKLLRGKPIEITLYSNVSKSEYQVAIDRDVAMKILAWSMNPDTNLLLQNQNIGQTTIDLIKSELGDKLVKFTEETVAYLSSSEYEQVNEVYSKLNNRYLPQIENYFPRQSVVEISGNQLMDGDLSSLFSAQNQSFVLDRSKNVADLKILGAGFSDILDEHLNGVAKYLAYAETAQKLNDVITSPDVNAFLLETGLKSLYKSSIMYSINPDLMKDSSLDNPILSKIQSSLTSVVLGLKLMQIPKQAASFINEFPDYNVFKNRPMLLVDLPAFVLEYAVKTKAGLDLRTFKRMYELSPGFRERVRGYVQGDLARLESGINNKGKSISQRNTKLGDMARLYKSVMSAPTSIGDGMGVIASLMVYDRNIANGMPQAEALERMEEFNTKQQSRRSMDMSALQRSPNFVTRFILMFGSTGILMYNKMYSSLTNMGRSIAAGKPPKASDVRTFYINYALSNVLFTLASNMFKLWEGDDEDIEEVMTDLKLAAAGINVLLAVPILGTQIQQWAYDFLDVKRKAEIGVDPFRRIKKQISEGMKEGQSVPRAAMLPIFELATKLNTDPFIGMYKGYTRESNADDLLYDLIGVSKSTRPWSYDVKKDKSMKEEDPETGEDVIKDEQEYSELSRRSSGAWYDKNQEELEKRREKREEEKENQ